MVIWLNQAQTEKIMHQSMTKKGGHDWNMFAVAQTANKSSETNVSAMQECGCSKIITLNALFQRVIVDNVKF